MDKHTPNIKITAIDNKLLNEHPEIIGLLQKAYSNEYLAWLVYKHAGNFIFGPWRESIIQHFADHAEEEEKHADWIGNRLSALGEAPTIDMKIIKRATQASGDWIALIEFIMQLEGEAVALYSSMLPMLDDHAGMRNTIEGFVDAEQEHFEDFEKMLRLLPVIHGNDQDTPAPEDSQTTES